jgi:hypothetical protein
MERKDFGCERGHDIAAWRRASENELKTCWRGKDMKHHAAVEALSSALFDEYGCNLNLVSSIAMKPYMQMKEQTDVQKAVKKRVLEMLVSTIKSDKNPFSKKQFGQYGMTEAVVLQIIKFCRTGSAIPDTVRIDFDCTKAEVECLVRLFERARSKCTKEDQRAILDGLYARIVCKRVKLLFNLR